MRFTIGGKHLIYKMDVSEKYAEKHLLEMFLTEKEVLMG